MLAASFPLFSRQMFQGMGIQWAGTLLGCVAAVLVPIPVIFYFYGKQMRMKSTFAPYFEPMQESCAAEDTYNTIVEEGDGDGDGDGDGQSQNHEGNRRGGSSHRSETHS